MKARVVVAYLAALAYENRKRLAYAFLVASVCGLGGLALDLDHVLVLRTKGLPITLRNLCAAAGRPLHWPIVLVLGSVCCLVSACVAGLFTYHSDRSEINE